MANCPRCNSINTRTDIETKKARFCTCLSCTNEFYVEKNFDWINYKKKPSKKQVKACLENFYGGGLFAAEKPKET